MSGSFVGSQSLDDRRRRRLAAGETGEDSVAEQAARPLPARAPSDRFPLRRIISHAQWKPALALLSVVGLAAGLLAIGYLPAIAGGKYGPGLAELARNHAANLMNVFLAGLLVVSAQYAWLIRWARARSFRDTRARYRIWWWTSTALALSAVFLLIGIPSALAETIVWATGRPPLWGSLAVYQLAPALAAIVLIFPGLQRDMRECRTSRGFLFLSGLLLLTAGAATIAPAQFQSLINRLGGPDTAPLILAAIWLAGVVSLFGAILFHARHVVFESVEPPEGNKQTRPAPKAEVAKASPPKKPAAKPRKSASKKSASPSSPEDTPESPVNSPSPSKPERTAPVAKAPAPPEPPPSTRWAEIGTIEVEGKIIRLDGPEDPMKGLSKRERRKLRKAIKDRQRSDYVEY